ncbi:MAG: hypothetical protein A2Y62_01195 [Candidatus Fischerbacteria bacterium RBG_13_37_8]|uniref:GH26 domain-containing protein n=1 Tax=Candidatus Fischerbacteria bacterium RBG_13_37_8 TaxID=1817863 RepID=A0A1F5VWN0_9BACT|nr:MAG: hypothetical protein A2Y62_01195 [Candidatus Fischerbacteria bacterium RBG_13_37_8]
MTPKFNKVLFLLFFISVVFMLGAIKNPEQVELQASGVIMPPANGCYAGVFPGWGPYEDNVETAQLTNFANMVGKGVAIVPFSVFWGRNTVSNQQLNAIAAYGAVPLLRLMPWGEPYWEPGYQSQYSMQKIIDGQFDQYIAQWADVVKNFNRPVMVTFGVEMNGDWFPWSGIYQGGGTSFGFGDSSRADGPERFAAAYRHIIQIFRNRAVMNVTWLFHVNNQSFPEVSWNTYDAYYPGDDYIDWIGVSIYGAQTNDEDWESFNSLAEPAYAALKARFSHKPIMLAEWGVGEFPSKGNKADWYTEALNKIRTDYTLFKMIIVYHERWENDDGSFSDLRVDSTPAALQAYKTGINQDYFISTITTAEQTKTVIRPR